MTQRIEPFKKIWLSRSEPFWKIWLKELVLFLWLKVLNFFKKKKIGRKVLKLLEYDSKIELFSWRWRNELNPFKTWLTELNHFCQIWLKELNLFWKIWFTLRIQHFWTFSVWLKELDFFFTWLKDLSHLLKNFDLQEPNFFSVWLKGLNLFSHYDSKTWSFFL